MAFGYEDCDAVYDCFILPTLKKLKITPIRVDRRQHKDDLNNYIIRMLKECDIALADITYARPSVYYEAGFAERTIPVVYTVRKDHLAKSQTNEQLRVHFDLQMKKIIEWRDCNGKTFAKRLKQRVSYLIKPLKQRMKSDNKMERDRKKFLTLSIVDRCQLINKTFANKLKNKHFWVKPLIDIDFHNQWSLDPAKVEIATKMIGRKCVMCAILTAESITQKQIQYAIHNVNCDRLVKNPQEIDKYEEYYYFCSLRKLSESRLTAVFPNARPSKKPHSFMLVRGKQIDPKQRKIYLHLLSPIDSIRDIQSQIDVFVEKHSNQRTNNYTKIIPNEYGHGAGISFM